MSTSEIKIMLQTADSLFIFDGFGLFVFALERKFAKCSSNVVKLLQKFAKFGKLKNTEMQGGFARCENIAANRLSGALITVADNFAANLFRS